MRIDVVKILTVVAPLVIGLFGSKVPKKNLNPYIEAAEASDKVFDSLQELAIEVRQFDLNPFVVIDTKNNEANFRSGIDIVEATIKAYEGRLEALKDISGLYIQEPTRP